MRNPATILIVDDESELVDLFAFEIEHAGFKVLKATNGLMAYRLAEETVVDVIVTDLRMAGGTGYELIRLVRERLSYNPKIIVVSGMGDDIQSQIQDLGIFDVLSKPLNFKMLTERIVSAIAH
jgi:DNA-binding response OmpR family regulator